MRREPESLVAGLAAVVAEADHRPLVVDPFAAVVAVSLFCFIITTLVYLQFSSTIVKYIKVTKIRLRFTYIIFTTFYKKFHIQIIFAVIQVKNLSFSTNQITRQQVRCKTFMRLHESVTISTRNKTLNIHFVRKQLTEPRQRNRFAFRLSTNENKTAGWSGENGRRQTTKHSASTRDDNTRHALHASIFHSPRCCFWPDKWVAIWWACHCKHCLLRENLWRSTQKRFFVCGGLMFMLRIFQLVFIDA